MTIWGANADELDITAAAIERAANLLDAIRTTLGSHVQHAPWHGWEADEFRRDWNEVHAARLAAASVFLRSAQGRLHGNAEQQRNASGERAGSGARATPARSLWAALGLEAATLARDARNIAKRSVDDAEALFAEPRHTASEPEASSEGTGQMQAGNSMLQGGSAALQGPAVDPQSAAPHGAPAPAPTGHTNAPGAPAPPLYTVPRWYDQNHSGLEDGAEACGVSSMAMVLDYWAARQGQTVTPREVQTDGFLVKSSDPVWMLWPRHFQSPVTGQTFDLGNLTAGGSHLGADAAGRAIDAALRRTRGPVIVYLNNSHYVVIQGGDSAHGYSIQDPWYGAKRTSLGAPGSPYQLADITQVVSVEPS